MPALCTVAPPSRFAWTRAVAMVAASPARIVPIGAPEPETNIVYADADVEQLRERGVLAMQFAGRARFVTHRLIDDAAIERAAEAIAPLVL